MLKLRCTSCKKLLCINDLKTFTIYIKCPRCKTVNSFLSDNKCQVLITDKDGKILYANNALSKVTGYSLNEILGSKPSLWGKQMSQLFYQKMWDRIKKTNTVARFKMNNINKNGKKYRVLLSVFPISNGNEVNYLGIEKNL